MILSFSAHGSMEVILLYSFWTMDVEWLTRYLKLLVFLLLATDWMWTTFFLFGLCSAKSWILLSFQFSFRTEAKEWVGWLKHNLLWILLLREGVWLLNRFYTILIIFSYVSPLCQGFFVMKPSLSEIMEIAKSTSFSFVDKS